MTYMPAQRGQPPWDQVRQAVTGAAEACAAAIALLALGDNDPGLVQIAEQAMAILRDTAASLRAFTFDEAVIEEERARAAADALAALRQRPAPRHRSRHLHAV